LYHAGDGKPNSGIMRDCSVETKAAKASKLAKPPDCRPAHLAPGEYTGGCVDFMKRITSPTRFPAHHATAGVFTGG
jgi:hypothetical protein